jgi:hypothetical protein
MDETPESAPEAGSPPKSLLRLSGYLLVLPHATGSKSESFAPHLVCEDQSMVRLHVQGENPFGASSLNSFHGRYVDITGHWGPRNRFLLVDGCSAKIPPFLK